MSLVNRKFRPKDNNTYLAGSKCQTPRIKKILQVIFLKNRSIKYMNTEPKFKFVDCADLWFKFWCLLNKKMVHEQFFANNSSRRDNSSPTILRGTILCDDNFSRKNSSWRQFFTWTILRGD